MTDRYLLGIDIGTYSSKGVLVTPGGRIAGKHTVQHSMEMPKPGFFEHDADKVWWNDFVVIVRHLLSVSGISPEQILSVGTSAIGSCVLPIDKNGKPLRKGILYGIDTRAEKEILSLERDIGREAIFKKSGVHLSSQASGPKILWIKNNEPEVYRKTRWFLTSQAYLVLKLTGETSLDIYTAGGYAPLFDVKNYCWDADHAESVTPTDTLPETSWSCAVAGKVTSEAASETGLLEGTPVITGTTDAAAEAISGGVANFGDMMLMIASSVFFIMKTQTMIQTDHFWSSPFLEKDSFAFTGGMSTSGSLTTWFRDNFAPGEVDVEKSGGENAFASLAGMASEVPIGSRGLVALPYFEGERTPIHDHKAKGVLFGLSLKHSRGDVYRAILEGVAFGIRHNLDVMKADGVVPRSIFAVGGGTRNLTWLQIIADVANITLNVPRQRIGASYGDAFMAGVGVGVFKNLNEIDQWVKEETSIEPDQIAHERYSENYEVFRSLYRSTRSLMHKLFDSQS